MNDLINPGTQLDHPISTYYSLKGQILSAASADAYKAVDQGKRGVCVWLTREPLNLGTEDVKNFISRLTRISQLDPPLATLSAFGVDSEGYGFLVLPQLDGQQMVGSDVEGREGERRFIACLRFVERLHNSGYVCGDLGGSSFWVDRAGGVSMVGLMGLSKGQGVRPPLEVLPYLAPDVRSGQATAASDVFSLGVIGYQLLTGAFPHGEGSSLWEQDISRVAVQPVSRYVNIPPVWADEVLLKCMQADPAARYKTVSEVLAQIQEIRNRVFEDEQAPAVVTPGGSSPSLVRSKDSEGVKTMPTLADARKQQAKVKEVTQEKESVDKKKLVLGLAAVAVVMLIGLAQLISRQPDIESDPEDDGFEQVANSDQGSGPIDPSISPEVKARIDKLRDSNDPLAHHLLTQGARDAGSLKLRQAYEEAVVVQARRRGLVRSAEQVKQWLRQKSGKELPTSYEAVLKTLDSAMPVDERSSFLREAYRSHPAVIIRLATALAFDLKDVAGFQRVLSQLIGDAQSIDGADQYSSIALILSQKDLSVVFADDIAAHKDTLTDEDILWVVEALAARNDVNTKMVATIGLERGLMSPLRQVFLELVRDRTNLEPEVQAALTRASGGSYSTADLESFGRWFDVEAEKVLLAVCADASDPVTLQEAFDILAGKSPTIQPSAALVEWVRDKNWDQRAKFAKAIGIFGFLDIATEAMVDEAFKSLDQFVRSSELIFVLLETNDSVIVSEVLKRYTSLIDLNTKLDMLRHPIKEVRMTAVTNLETNQVGALKIIVDSFEAEQDEEVKKLYHKFWMIRERLGIKD